MINSYRFGSITVNGKNYTQDIWLDFNGQVEFWQRKASHIIEKSDLVFKERPEIVIIGTGQVGVAEVSSDVLTYLKKEKIDFFIEPTGKAVELYNQFKTENKKVIGFFHLTC